MLLVSSLGLTPRRQDLPVQISLNRIVVIFVDIKEKLFVILKKELEIKMYINKMSIHSLKINHYWIPDNLCYPHFEQGPCAPGEQFRAHPKETGPACIVWGKTSQFDSKSALTG